MRQFTDIEIVRPGSEFASIIVKNAKNVFIRVLNVHTEHTYVRITKKEARSYFESIKHLNVVVFIEVSWNGETIHLNGTERRT